MSPNPLKSPEDIRLQKIAGPSGLIMFGVTGDLSRKKLLPAIYDLANRGLLPPAFSIVGFARREWSREDFEKFVHDAVKQYSRTNWSESVWEQLVRGIRFVSGQHDDEIAFGKLKQVVDELDSERGTAGNHTFYLSIPPRDFPLVLGQLEKSGLSQAGEGQFRRVVVEKPFGSDLKSARELNEVVERVFPPDSVFRIDHYLGKETVQNLLALRFANQLFEPIWSSQFIDHVQITMAEDIGIGGRAGYYDGIGAARDVIQNHLLQLLALTAMEKPKSFDAAELRSSKEAVLAAVKLPSDLSKQTAHGQYVAGWQGGQQVAGYLDEDGITEDSKTETYAAMKLEVDTPRWQGAPFYLRAGKRLGRRVTEIAVVFKRPEHHLFGKAQKAQLGENALVIRVQPNEGVTIRFGSKVPGPSMQVRDVTMDFGYGHAFTEDSPEAYERLILDVLLGEPPLFPRQREVELSWQILDPIVRHWASSSRPESYAPGSWGPESAEKMLERDGRSWRIP
ncbi:MAG: glucose-6-phosphate dehydrogenase [Aquiluna sp.]